jgi:hypothetical protein
MEHGHDTRLSAEHLAEAYQKVVGTPETPGQEINPYRPFYFPENDDTPPLPTSAWDEPQAAEKKLTPPKNDRLREMLRERGERLAREKAETAVREGKETAGKGKGRDGRDKNYAKNGKEKNDDSDSDGRATKWGDMLKDGGSKWLGM